MTRVPAAHEKVGEQITPDGVADVISCRRPVILRKLRTLRASMKAVGDVMEYPNLVPDLDALRSGVKELADGLAVLTSLVHDHIKGAD